MSTYIYTQMVSDVNYTALRCGSAPVSFPAGGRVVAALFAAALFAAALFAAYLAQLPERERHRQDAEEQDLDQQKHGPPQ